MQMSLFESEIDAEVNDDCPKNLSVESDSLTDEILRLDGELKQHFGEKIQVYPSLSRKIVSFQANKEKPESRWFKYKEAFSTELVRYLIQEYEKTAAGRSSQAPDFKSGVPMTPAQIYLDPFAGAGTVLFACSASGINSDGIELLPIGQEIIAVRKSLRQEFQEEQFYRLIFWQTEKPWNQHSCLKPLNHLRITQGAYPPETEAAIARYLYSLDGEDATVQRVLRFALLCILESISYTRKDGQYLRWDKRANRAGGSQKFDKGKILSFDGAIAEKLAQIIDDTFYAKESQLFLRDWPPATGIANRPPAGGRANREQAQINLLPGSCLQLLPNLNANYYNGIITSPPYCNRYDYTRTYALELALLGIGEREIVKLRQDMVSCTVENKQKSLINSWQKAIEASDRQELLQSILQFLNRELARKKLNNNGIPRMVRGYFYEMACVIEECYRVLQNGAPLFMVNDNVRYAGVNISVDTILSQIAEDIGFEVEKILILAKGKGNSSQQMGIYGRESLRKCVYVWRKA